MPAPWAHRYAPRTKTAKSTIIRELLKLTNNPDIIALVGPPEVISKLLQLKYSAD